MVRLHATYNNYFLFFFVESIRFMISSMTCGSRPPSCGVCRTSRNEDPASGLNADHKVWDQ